MAFAFTRYAQEGAIHWEPVETRSIRKFNAYQAANYRRILTEAGDLHGKTAVDLGAGDGALSSQLVRAGANVTLVDNDKAGLELAEKMFEKRGLNATFVLGEAHGVPLPDGCADVVISSEVIEHLDHPKEHIAEAHRLLRPGGIFVLTTPYKLGEIPMSPYHVHEYYPTELKTLVETSFPEVRVIESHHLFWFALYGYRFRALRKRQLGYYFINMLALWFGRNPFMRDASNREKREYFAQLTIRAVKA